MFIRDLKRLKSLGVLKREALLINATLVKSGRTQLYEELPAEAETSVDEFVKYLKKAYGMNRFDMMKESQNVNQGPTENPHTFLSRVITLFYEAKGKEKKTIADIKKSEEETYEIASIFWRGLHDRRVQIMLKQRMDGLKIENLADVTKNIESSYEELQAVNMINNVDISTEETSVLHVGNSKWKNHGRCFCCGKIGHLAKNCWYNPANQTENQESSSRDS